MGRGTTSAIAAAALLGALAVARVHTQAPARTQDVMPEILAEVRGLRAALEQMVSAGPRVQLALGRLQLQEQRLHTSIRRLEDARARLADAQQSMAHHQSQLSSMEAEMSNTAGNSEVKPQIADAVRFLRRQIAQASAEIQRLTGAEAELANEVAADQARWTDFNSRLEELERTLGPRQPAP